MKLPRGVSADRLISVLESLGYRIIRRKGSHVRLRHPGPPAHSVSVPYHASLKIGTLHGILTAVAAARGMETEELSEKL